MVMLVLAPAPAAAGVLTPSLIQAHAPVAYTHLTLPTTLNG